MTGREAGEAGKAGGGEHVAVTLVHRSSFVGGEPELAPRLCSGHVLELAVRDVLEVLGERLVDEVEEAPDRIGDQRAGERERPVGHPRGDALLEVTDARRNGVLLVDADAAIEARHLIVGERPDQLIRLTEFREAVADAREKDAQLDITVDHADPEIDRAPLEQHEGMREHPWQGIEPRDPAEEGDGDQQFRPGENVTVVIDRCRDDDEGRDGDHPEPQPQRTKGGEEREQEFHNQVSLFCFGKVINGIILPPFRQGGLVTGVEFSRRACPDR